GGLYVVARLLFARYSYSAFYLFYYGFRHYSVRLVIFVLHLAAALSFVYGAPHAARYGVGIHYDPALGVARGAAYRLNARRFAAQKTLFVGVEYGNQLHFG